MASVSYRWSCDSTRMLLGGMKLKYYYYFPIHTYCTKKVWSRTCEFKCRNFFPWVVWATATFQLRKSSVDKESYHISKGFAVKFVLVGYATSSIFSLQINPTHWGQTQSLNPKRLRILYLTDRLFLWYLYRSFITYHPLPCRSHASMVSSAI